MLSVLTNSTVFFQTILFPVHYGKKKMLLLLVHFFLIPMCLVCILKGRAGVCAYVLRLHYSLTSCEPQ